MSDRESPAGPLSADLLQALVEQSLELIAITDGTGTITWANARFIAATGVSGGEAVRLVDCAAAGVAGDSTREKLGAGLAAGTLETSGLRLRTVDDSPLWVDVRARRAAGRMLWTFSDVSSTRFLAAQARRQGEMLDTAQEFGRIGLWERRIPSGEGRWDRHVFGFWGLDPANGTPPFEEAIQRIHPDDRKKMIYAESTKRAGRYSQRYRVVRPDGQTRLIHSQWAVKNGPHGTPDRAVGIMMDDTEAYESARTLDDVNARLKLAVDLGQIAIWRHDLRTQRMYYSDRAFQLLQQEPRPEGLPIEEVRSYIHPDDIPLVLASAKKALTSHQPTDMEARYRGADGNYRYVMTRRVVERDEAGVPLAFVGVALDVTERVEQRQQAEELARRLEAASHAAGIGLWTTAFDPPETDWNAQTFAIFDRFPPPRVPGLAEWLGECVHPDDRERVGREIRGYLKQPAGRQETEFRVLRRDGSVRWVVMRADTDTASVERQRVLGVVIDVTEARQAELVRQQAVLAEREIHAKSQFLSRMSHELRTPLNAVLGFTQLLQIDARRSADTAQLAKLGHIRAAGDHLLSLINDVLDLSGLESGALKLALGAVDLGMLVRQSVSLVESLAAQHGVIVEIAEARGAACGDATRLRQVLINLLSNAIKYNRRGGRVVVRAAPAGAKAVLRVRDTGRGLTPMQLTSLFEPFNRFGAENEGIEGTGIGLTIVKALVEGMGGSVAVSSKPGEGTQFEVVLATATDDLDRADPAEVADSAPAPWSEPRRERAGQILYIEDNQVNVLLVEELVKTVSGLAITSEASGRAGVARAKALCPDLVLIDLQLPDFDGFEVLRRLRAEPSTAAIPCIALSANAMPEDVERGLAAGFADYWTKPIDFPAFLTALKKRFPTTRTVA